MSGPFLEIGMELKEDFFELESAFSAILSGGKVGGLKVLEKQLLIINPNKTRKVRRLMYNFVCKNKS